MEETTSINSFENVTLPRIKKNKLRVAIYTHKEKIIGQVHHLPNDRLSDCMNQENQKFLPVTNADVFDLQDNNFEYKVAFLLINKNHVNILYPLT